MKSRIVFILILGLICATFPMPAPAQESSKEPFKLEDIFELEFASDPQISPDGEQVVYVRNCMDIMKDKQRSNLWMVNIDGSNHRPLTSGNVNDDSPVWSPDGKSLAYVSKKDSSAQIIRRWLDTGQTHTLTHLPSGPKDLVWSPDGKHIAFSMFVVKKVKPLVKLPEMPKGAEWAAPPKEIRKLTYRFDGQGYLKDGYFQLFVVPAEGGTARQITAGNFHHKGTIAWTPDSKTLIFSANRDKDWEHHPRESNLYEVNVNSKKIKQLTTRKGPDFSPTVSPDGKHIAYLGFDNRYQGYQLTRLYVMKRDGSGAKLWSGNLDRSVSQPKWMKLHESKTVICFQFDDQGVTKVGMIGLSGDVVTTATQVGGTTIGRPYASGSYSVNDRTPKVVFTYSTPQHPADIAVWDARTKKTKRITHLNADLLGHRKLATVEEINFKSSHDGRPIQGWIMKPPGFDPNKKYPSILEIHGGPFANYGPRFSAEMQLYAAKGYVVFYCNPRGSTSYGEKFGNLIHHAYPGNDYYDLMSGVDAVIRQGYIDEKNLFVTGGSGGGVLTAWIIGMTKRFTAAVVGKPVINWYSFVLTADAYSFFTQYWFPGPPWEHAEHYLKRSPLSLVGNVTTPTMLITGESDHRTPMSESEQYYQALQLRKVKSMLVRIPGASHNIAARPSQLIAKVAYVLRWFEMHRR